MRPSTAASIVLLFVLMAGCEHPAPYTFQIIDAQTHQGLEDVKFEAIVSGALPEDDPSSTFIARTDRQGYLQLPLPAEQGLHYFLFLTRPGYEVISGQLYPLFGISDLKTYPSETLPAMVISRPLADIPIMHPGATVIAMHRLGASKP